MKTDIKVNYEQLLKKFDELLTSTSRGFDTEHEFLESWVPDNDINQSLIDLISSANDYNVNFLKIELTQEILNKINLDLIKNRHKNSGKIKIIKDTLEFNKNN